MTNWYVDSSSGSDANDGLSLCTPFATLMHAHDQTNPGDTVNVMPGKNYGGGTSGAAVLHITRSGSAAGGYITYQGWPTQPKPLIAGDQGYGAIYIDVASYIIIKNFELAGWNGSLSLASAWTNMSGASPTASNVYNSNGIASNNNLQNIATSAGTTAGGTVLTFSSSPISAGVVVGSVVYDTTHATAIPAGAVVTAVTSTTVTLSVAVASPGVSSGDSIQFMQIVHHVGVYNCIVHDFPANGIGIGICDYVTISGNVCYNNAWYSPLGGSGISTGSHRDVDTNFSIYKNQVIGNFCFNNRQLVGTNVASVTDTTSATTASGTTLTFASTGPIPNTWYVYDTTTPACIQAGTTVVSQTSTTIQLSLPVASSLASGHVMRFAPASDGEGIIIDDNQNDQIGSQPYAGKVLVANNLCVNNGSCGIEAYDDNNVDIVFNTCYLNQNLPPFGSQGEISLQGSKNSNCYNNIMYVVSTAPPIPANQGTGTTSGYNLVYGGNLALPGSNNVVGNPLFVNANITPTVTTAPYAVDDFQLTPTSPAIDAGTASFTRATDILGNVGLFGPSYDMGAYESPNSTFGGNTILPISTLIGTTFRDGQLAGSITPALIRQLITSLWSGRSPWPR